MKKFKFTDGTGRIIYVKSSAFSGACLVAAAFMPGYACIGWGPYHG